MKIYLSPLVPAVAVSLFLGASAISVPQPIYTNTEQPNLAPLEGIDGQTDDVKLNAASPTGAVKNMAPVRGNPFKEEFVKPGESASGLPAPGATIGSRLGTGSNSTLVPVAKPDETPAQLDIFED